MSTPTQQVCARCGSPADTGDAFCGNCGASTSRPVTQVPAPPEYVRREPGTDSAERSASASGFNLSPQAGPRPDWTYTMRFFVRRLPVWARLVAVGVIGLFILIGISGIKDSGGHSTSYNLGYAAGEVTGNTVATQTDPSAVSSWCAQQQLMIGVPDSPDITNAGDWNIGWYAGCQAGALGQ